jgi:uncharacterized protein (DUF2461 family)
MALFLLGIRDFLGDLVITDTPAFQILNEAMKGMSRTLNIIRKPRKSLFSKRKRAITCEQ